MLTELNLSLKMKAPLELISKSKVLFDPSLEFNAPKYCDLSSLHDLTVMDIINIDPWNTYNRIHLIKNSGVGAKGVGVGDAFYNLLLHVFSPFICYYHFF